MAKKSGNSGKDELFWNKVFGGVLASVLGVMVINEVGGVVYSPEHLEEAAYVIEVPESASAGAAVEEEIDFGALLASADLAKGGKVAKKCLSCHSFEKGGKTGTGPNLWGVVNAPKGTRAGFGNYSKAMEAMGGSWDIDSLNAFLESPKKFMSGTGMSFVGLRKPQDRANMIAYLNSMGDSPVTFAAPAAPEMPAE